MEGEGSKVGGGGGLGGSVVEQNKRDNSDCSKSRFAKTHIFRERTLRNSGT